LNRKVAAGRARSARRRLADEHDVGGRFRGSRIACYPPSSTRASGHERRSWFGRVPR
jgi:hypothetical protein